MTALAVLGVVSLLVGFGSLCLAIHLLDRAQDNLKSAIALNGEAREWFDKSVEFDERGQKFYNEACALHESTRDLAAQAGEFK